MNAQPPPSSVSTYTLPGSSLAVIDPPKSFPVSHKDWAHLRQGVTKIQFPLRWAENVMWISIPLIPAATLALLTWGPVYATLGSEAQVGFAYVTPALWAIGIGALIIAAYSGLVARATKDIVVETREHCLSDMDEMYKIGNPPESLPAPKS